MKNVIKMILLGTLCISLLSACGANESAKTDESAGSSTTTSAVDTATTSTEPSKNVEEANVGDILDKPEIEPDVNAINFYADFSYADDKNETGISTMEIALDDSSDPAIIYITNGSMKLDEAVYELSSSGTVTKYKANVFAEGFTKDTETSQETLVQEKDNLIKMLSMLGYGFSASNPSYKYKKCKSENAVFTGDAFVYECMNGNNTDAKIWVDKATGMIVKIIDADGKSIMTVQKLKTDDIGIPEYK